MAKTTEASSESLTFPSAAAPMVGSSRHGRFGRALMGSTAEQILHKAPCELAKFAVAVDGSPDSRAALKRGEELEREAGAALRVLVAHALAEAGKPDIDLLIFGSRRPRDRFLLGSVTKHLIAEAPCPVLVVPHPK